MWLKSEHGKYLKNEGNTFLMKTLIILSLSYEIIRNYSFKFCFKIAFLSSAYEDVQGHFIVNRREWLSSPANIKGANKDAKIYFGRSTTLHNLLFCPHTLCMNYTLLLVSSKVHSKQLLCFVQGHGQKNFDEFHNHSPLLTMDTFKTFSMEVSDVKIP